MSNLQSVLNTEAIYARSLVSYAKKAVTLRNDILSVCTEYCTKTTSQNFITLLQAGSSLLYSRNYSRKRQPLLIIRPKVASQEVYRLTGAWTLVVEQELLDLRDRVNRFHPNERARNPWNRFWSIWLYPDNSWSQKHWQNFDIFNRYLSFVFKIPCVETFDFLRLHQYEGSQLLTGGFNHQPATLPTRSKGSNLCLDLDWGTLKNSDLFCN